MIVNTRDLRRALDDVAVVRPLTVMVRLSPESGIIELHAATEIGAAWTMLRGTLEPPEIDDVCVAVPFVALREHARYRGQTATLAITSEALRLDGIAIGPATAAEIPFWPNPMTCRVDALAFRQAIGQVKHAAAREESRPVLAGIHVQAAKRRLILEAADGFRLAQAAMPCGGRALRVILPRTLAASVSERMSGGTIRIERRKNADYKSQRVWLGTDTTMYALPEIDGEFPETAQIIRPADQDRVTATVLVRDLRALARGARPFHLAAEPLIAGNPVRVVLGETVRLSVPIDNQAPPYDCAIPATASGITTQVDLNLDYLIDLSAAAPRPTRRPPDVTVTLSLARSDQVVAARAGDSVWWIMPMIPWPAVAARDPAYFGKEQADAEVRLAAEADAEFAAVVSEAVPA